jgi:hypothetical protein
MANMSYCRFENTLGDLGDCFNALQERAERDPAEREPMSTHEEAAMRRLIALCGVIYGEFGGGEFA